MVQKRRASHPVSQTGAQLTEIMEVLDTIDPRGIITYNSFDMLGQQTSVIDAYTNGTVTASTNQTTDYTLDANGDQLTQTAVESTGNNQTTQYDFGTTGTIGTNLFSNDLLAETQFPNLSTGAAGTTSSTEQTLSYNLQGETTSFKDQDGNVHQYTIDPLGRETADSVTTLGSGVDGTVRQLAYAYNDAGLMYQETSYASSTGGTVVNQEQDAYNGFQQLITQYQSVSGAVNTSTTPAVGYNYNADADGENNSKLESEVYPNGRVEDYDYGQGQEPVTGISVSGTTATVTTAVANGLSTGTQVDIEGSSVSALDGLHTITYVNSTHFTFPVPTSTSSDTASTDMTEVPTNSLDFTISRPDGIQDHGGSAAGTVVQSDTFLGLSTIVQETNGNNTELTYIQQSPAPTPTPTTIDSGGDRYSGLDRFGRVNYQNWITTSTGAQVQGDQYGYDADNNVLYDNIVGLGTTAAKWSQLYHASSTTSGDDNFAYDQLNRFTQDIRGTLSASGNNASSDAPLDTITNANINTNAGSDLTYTLDAVGNWTSSATGAGTGTSTAPTLTSTSRTGNSQNELTAVGSNTLTEDNNGNTTKDQTGNTFTYDAWDRPISDSAGSTSYRYLPDGDRVVTTTGTGGCCATSVDSFYSVDMQVLEDDAPSGSSYVIKSQYVWGLGYVNQMVERDDNSSNGSLGTSTSGLGERIYPLQDADYNVRALTSTSGSALQYFVYDAYGNATLLNTSYGTTGTSFGNDSHSWIYGFQGGRYDVNTGLYRFGARDYSPVLGRWMEQDPAGYVDGANLYQMERGGTEMSVDPLGLNSDTSLGPQKHPSYPGPAPDEPLITHATVFSATSFEQHANVIAVNGNNWITSGWLPGDGEPGNLTKAGLVVGTGRLASVFGAYIGPVIGPTIFSARLCDIEHQTRYKAYVAIPWYGTETYGWNPFSRNQVKYTFAGYGPPVTVVYAYEKRERITLLGDVVWTSDWIPARLLPGVPATQNFPGYTTGWMDE